MSESDPDRYSKEGWKVRIEGIEAYTGYLHEGHKFVYEKIHVGEAKEIMSNLGKFDVIFFGDIIEHFPLNEGKQLLKTAISHANKCVMLTTPKYDTYQAELCNNPLEYIKKEKIKGKVPADVYETRDEFSLCFRKLPFSFFR